MPHAADFDPDTAPRQTMVLSVPYKPGIGDWHAHRRAQLIHASEGVVTVQTKSGHWVVPPQRAVWMPPGERHCVSSRRGYQLTTVYIGRSAGLPTRPAVVAVSALLDELLKAAALAGGKYPRQGPAARLMRVLLDQLPTELLTHEIPSLHLPEPRDARLRRMMAPVLADPACPTGLAELAAAAGLSMRSASRMFLMETGLTPGDWRTQRRLLSALEALIQGESVTQVALAVGYQDTSSFIAVFRRAFGVTPGSMAKVIGATG
ncbi:MAG: helix-turn-helix transcriptional regulator [Rubrivivax sp.]|nr:helix-turn-helix transcriptional regulator [Rubrivivax sp.]